ncbi:MAG: TIGR01777 family oxidoreductase [Acidobacteriota bacterium]
MRVLVSGASGLIGPATINYLQAAGHDVVRLVRTTSSDTGVRWDPAAGKIDRAALHGIGAVIHLAGESIAEGRWTRRKKARIRDSRVRGTRLLCEALARLLDRPAVLVSASAMGYYGDRGDEVLREESPPGSGFLADVCREWEAAADPAREAGIRVVHLRSGLVLSALGGALARMITPFKLGVGGTIGDGRQYMSWVSLDDLVGVIRHALENEGLEGPVNAVAPNPVTNAEFTRALGKALSRPTVFRMPARIARLALGEMAEDLLLASARLVPARLLACGFTFRHPDIESALRHVLRGG